MMSLSSTVVSVVVRDRSDDCFFPPAWHSDLVWNYSCPISCWVLVQTYGIWILIPLVKALITSETMLILYLVWAQPLWYGLIFEQHSSSSLQKSFIQFGCCFLFKVTDKWSIFHHIFNHANTSSLVHIRIYISQSKNVKLKKKQGKSTGPFCWTLFVLTPSRSSSHNDVLGDGP